jgi:hypothetical protein
MTAAEWGKVLGLFPLYLSTVKYSGPSQLFTPKTERWRKSGPPHVSTASGLVPPRARIEETWRFFLTRRAGRAVKQGQGPACAAVVPSSVRSCQCQAIPAMLGVTTQ